MKRVIVQPNHDLQHASPALNPNDVSSEMLNSGGGHEDISVAPERLPRKPRQTSFDPGWHDATEIVVPFDRGSFSGLLVDEKTFQAAYSRNLPPPPVVNQRLEIERSSGSGVFTTDWWDDLMSFCSGSLFFVEAGAAVWTAALLFSGFPMAIWLAYTLESAWALVLITLKFSLAKPAAYRLFLWLGSCVTTVCWLVWSPWSKEFLARFSAYFFRT